MLVEPDNEDQERTFHSRTPLTGEIATEESPSLSFVLALQPIKSGKLGRCVLTGVTPARVFITNETDTTCELAPEETVLASTPMGGIPILWKEEGTGETWGPGDLYRRPGGSSHAFRAIGSHPFVFAIVLREGIALEEPPAPSAV